MGKIKETRQLYKTTLKEISSSPSNWRTFLDSSAWNFKYDFDDQVLIFAQRPDARACATMDEWNRKLKRWVNNRAEAIYVYDKNPNSEYPFKLVFDLSDTHNYNNTEYKLWNIKQEYEKDIIEDLEANFGDMDLKEDLSKAIISASYNMVVDDIEDYLTDIIKNKSNTMLNDISDDEIKDILIGITWASVSYMLMIRCGINARENISENEFEFLKYFNSPELFTILGASVSDIAESGLREIAKTVSTLQKKENLKNRTFAKNENEIYSNDNNINEGGVENVRENRVHETGRLLDTKSNNEKGENSSREIFDDEVQLPIEPQESRTNNIGNEQRIKQSFTGDTRPSEQESGNASGRDVEEGEYNRRIESSRSNEMGWLDEQYQDDSRGDSSNRTDLSIEESQFRRTLTEEEMRSKLDFLQDEYVSDILNNIDNLKVTKKDIREFYQNNLIENDRVEFIKKAFGDAYTEIVVNDTRLGYKAYENVLHLWKDGYLNRTAEVYYKWNYIAEYIEGLIMVNEFHDMHKPVKSYDEQMQLLQVEAMNAPTFSFTQEIIDYELTRGSNIQESKMRIYNQFINSLSSEENIKFLKNEYGWGGGSTIHIGTRIGYQYDGKGITLTRGKRENEETTIITWNVAEKRIKELIKLDKYLNSKEKEEYSNWLKQKEIDRELQGSKKKLLEESKKQKEDAEQQLAERLYKFVKDFDFYNYVDNTEMYRSEEDNINIIKADINDTNNVKDYIKELKEIIDDSRLSNEDLKEVQELVYILEQRVPKYKYHLGDTIYIGSDEYEFAGINNGIVKLYDVKFPLFNKEMPFEEFERKVQENYANEHLIVKDKQIQHIETAKQNNEEKYQDDVVEQEQEKHEETKQIENNIEKLDIEIKKQVKPKRTKIQDYVLHPEIPINERNNFKINNENLGVGTPREKFAKNVAAIQVLKKCENENRYATLEEQEILSNYVGWGGLQQAFDEKDSSWTNEYRILKELLTEDEYKSARESTLTAFYTPPVVINSIYEVLQNMGLKEANVLEPACGTGNFWGLLPKELSNCKIYGVEKDSISGRIAQQLYQKSTIAISGYEKVDMPDSFFDVAIGNVPFGDISINDRKYNKNHFLIHDYFFAKTIDKVRPRRNCCFCYIKRNNG